MKTVYADVVLITNFCLDFVVLFISTRFLNLNVHIKRIFIASVMGAIFALVCAVMVDSSFLRLVFSMLFLPFMCFMCIGRTNKKTICRMNVAMYIFSFMLCGITAALLNSLGGNTRFPFLLCLVGAGLLTYFSRYVSRWFLCCMSESNKMVEITVGKKKVKYSLLCDSGNRLVDPYVNLPVILLRCSEKTKLLELTTPVRILPITTAVGTGLAEGFTPDCIMVKQGKTRKRVMASVCFVRDENLSDNCMDGILPSVLI